MDPLILAGLITVLLLLLIFIGMPIAFAMGIAGGLGIVILGGTSTVLYTLGTFPVGRCASYVLTVIPMYIFMGNLSTVAGIPSDAYGMASKWLGGLKGGLVMVTIGACGIFAATTGSSTAEAAAMGKIAVPEMRKRGYDVRLCVGSVASAAALGMLIPPSINLVIYGIVAAQSIGKLFIAGILPGILSIILYMGMVYVRVSLNPKLAPTTEKVSWNEKGRSLMQGWGALVLFVTVIGGLYAGIATPTQIGALGSLAALILGFLQIWRGESNWTMLKKSLLETGELCAIIFTFIIGAGIFSLFITMSGVVPWLVEFTTGLPIPRLGMLIIIILFYLPLGMFFDPTAMILVTVPIVHPIIVQGLGFDPIWFGIILIILIEISVITPPMAVNLYVIKGLFPEVTINDIFMGSLWFLIMELLVIVILIVFPSIATWLPSTMG